MTESIYAPFEAGFWQLVETRLAQLTEYAAKFRDVEVSARLHFTPERRNPLHVFIAFAGDEDAPCVNAYGTNVLEVIHLARREIKRLAELEQAADTDDGDERHEAEQSAWLRSQQL